MRGGEIRRVERLGERFELGDDGWGHLGGVELPEENTESSGAVVHLFTLRWMGGGGGGARVVERAKRLRDGREVG